MEEKFCKKDGTRQVVPTLALISLPDLEESAEKQATSLILLVYSTADTNQTSAYLLGPRCNSCNTSLNTRAVTTTQSTYFLGPFCNAERYKEVSSPRGRMLLGQNEWGDRRRLRGVKEYQRGKEPYAPKLLFFVSTTERALL